MEVNFEFLNYQNKIVDCIPDEVVFCGQNNTQVSLLDIDPYVGLIETIYAIKTIKNVKHIQKIMVIPKDKSIHPLARNCYYNYGGPAAGFHVYGFIGKGSGSYFQYHEYSKCFKLCLIETEKVYRQELFNSNNIMTLLPQYKYSGYNKCSGIYAIDYLAKLDKFPVAEMLMKLHINRMWDDKALKFIQENKPFQKYLYKFREEINRNRMAFSTVKNAYKKNPELSPENYYTSLMYRMKCGRENAGIRKDVYKKILKYTTQEKIRDYLEKTKIGNSTYSDYLIACEWLHLKFDDTKVLFPKDFNYWHDLYTTQYAQYVAEAEEKAHIQISEKLKQTAEKFGFIETKIGDYFVLVAKSKKDLIFEGEILSHCVGKMNYDKKQAEGKSLICFIRKEINTPYATCELDLTQKSLKIRQVYGKNNSQITEPDFLDFKEKWIKKINQTYKKVV